MKKKIDYYGEGKWETRPKQLYHRETTAINLITPILKPDFKFLDAGCGTCHFLHELSLKQQNVNFFGLDNSEFQIKKAKIENPSFRLKKCDLEEKWPFDNNFFDFVYGGEIIEHLHSPDFFLSEANRILKKGGCLVISTPNLCAWFNRLIFPFGFQPFFYESSTKSKQIGGGFFNKFRFGETPVGHIRLFNTTAIKDLLKDNGFEIVKMKGTIFDSGFPKWLLQIDKLFTIYPPFSAGFVILAKKVK